MKPTIALFTGDPAGIGPELIARLLAQGDLVADANVVLLGDAWLWEDGQRVASLRVATTPVASLAEVRGRADAHVPAFLAMRQNCAPAAASFELACWSW